MFLFAERKRGRKSQNPLAKTKRAGIGFQRTNRHERKTKAGRGRKKSFRKATSRGRRQTEQGKRSER